VLGIGIDDIFVFCSFFDATRPYANHFALDTRLTLTFMRSSGATLATSTTSAFAFASNIFSPVPAVQSFGLLLATLVIVNWLLVITFTPVALAVRLSPEPINTCQTKVLADLLSVFGVSPIP
jgi:predicted RND superfamily exporter protein